MLTRVPGRLAVAAACILLCLPVIGCEKVPLLAPTGSTITLTASTNVLSANGTTPIIAQVLEAAGTPPHSGTHIVFTTTLGRIEPAEVETDASGRASATFIAGSNNGSATIAAFSGGATTGAEGAIKIAVGTAAVGSVSVTANPNPISSNGGTAAIVAQVFDTNGNALAAAPVRFTTSAGSVANGVVNTDQSGVAQTTLNTTSQAIVTATVGISTGQTPGGTAGTQASATVTVAVNPIPTVSITAPTGTIIANSPVTFTLNVSPGANSTAQIRDVSVNFGDGTPSVSLGAVSGASLSVQHLFEDDGTFVVRVTVLDTLGGQTSGATQVVVQPEPPLSVTISSSQSSSGGTTFFTFTATVTPSTATVASYLWNFGDASSPQLTTGPQVTHSYSTGSGVKNVSVDVTTTTGRTARATINVNP